MILHSILSTIKTELPSSLQEVIGSLGEFNNTSYGTFEAESAKELTGHIV